MMIYFAMAAFFCLGALLWQRQPFAHKNSAQTAFLLCAGAILVAVATLRYGIGYDYFNYQELYEQLGPMPVAQLLQDHVALEFPGYALYTRLCYLLGLSYRGLLLVTNLFLTSVVLWFIKKYSPLPWLSLYLYLTMQFFAHSMNLFRQSIAATICLLAYPFLKKRKLLPFVLIVLIAATFHVSAVFLLPFYWVLNWKADGRIYAVIGAVCVPFYLFSNQAAQFLTQYLFPNYAGYIGSRYWVGLGERYAVYPILYFAAVFLLRKKLLSADSNNRQLINSAFYVMLLYIFSTHHMILERFSIYLFMYGMILLPKLVDCFGTEPLPVHQAHNARERRMISEQKKIYQEQSWLRTIAAVLVIACSFGYLIFASVQSTNGFHKVYPYVSVFEEQ